MEKLWERSEVAGMLCGSLRVSAVHQLSHGVAGLLAGRCGMAGGLVAPAAPVRFPLQHFWVLALRLQLPGEGCAFLLLVTLGVGLGLVRDTCEFGLSLLSSSQVPVCSCRLHFSLSVPLILAGSSLSLLFIQFPSWVLVWRTYSIVMSGSRLDVSLYLLLNSSHNFAVWPL